MSSNGSFDTDEAIASEDQSAEELRVQLELLAEENQQIRESYTQAKTTQYRRTALGLGIIGAIAVAGGVVIPTAREVLFSLGAIGLFAGVLTYYLTPEQFVSADVGRDVYTALAGNEATLVSELGLADERVYVPTDGPDAARLFIPQDSSYTIPDSDALSQMIVATRDGKTRGVALDPSSQQLYDAVGEAVAGELASTPNRLADQLTESIVEQFEIASSASPDVDSDGGRLTVAVSGSAYGPIDRFDHPIPSLLATGFADRLDTPVSVDIVQRQNDNADHLVTCRWETSE